VPATSPSLHDKATYYSAMFIETGEVEVMAVTENCAGRPRPPVCVSCERPRDPLMIIWDNAPAHRSINHHTMADFRVKHEAELDALLMRSVAPLLSEGAVDLARTAQDGVRIRASAVACSSRRQDTLTTRLQQAEERVQHLKANPQAVSVSLAGQNINEQSPKIAFRMLK
jgi:hypothetical protein